ncbi:MAG TPA: 50S ribosomal protein L3, partial [Dehalococcoidia bacterium]|nr:50S ribosomal protein L3 [Dehalococcoidia bacterium]
MIPGVIGKKLGMTQLYQDTGEVAVTAVLAGPCYVTHVKTAEKDGYNAVQLGFEESKRLSDAEKGHLKDMKALKHLHEFRVDAVDSVKVAQVVDVDVFKPGDKVDVIGISKGKGYAGGVKRYHFSGGPKTHGQSDRHRGPGSIGSGTTPGRVLKGLKMAGHMGHDRVTAKNLQIVDVDTDRHVLLIKGAIPGWKKGIVFV